MPTTLSLVLTALGDKVCQYTSEGVRGMYKVDVVK